MLKGRLSSEIVNERQQYINSLKRFVLEKKEKLQQVLERLQFREESLSNVEAKELCPYDANHFVPEHAFKKHVEKCRLLHAGYQEDELPSQLQNLDFCYEGKQVMKVNIDESLLNKIIWDDCVNTGQVYTGHRTMPVSHIDEAVNLTQSDRLAIYNHVIKVSHEAGKVIPVDKTDQLLTTDWGQLVKKGMLNEESNQQYSSKLEQLAALRDMKRRRQSYRAKNVHVTKKSYTEIIREVIVNQMELLTPEKESSKKNVSEERKEEKGSSRDRRKKHGDRDSYRDKDSYRRRRSRDRSRDISRERRRDGDRKERRSRDEKRDDISDEDRSHLDTDFTDVINNVNEVRERLEVSEMKKESCSYELSQRERESGKRRRESESSQSSDDKDDYHHKSKHKKSKSRHKKKHSKKHKK